MRWFSLILVSLVAVGMYSQRGDDIVVKKAISLMGTDFEISVVAPTEQIGYINIDEAVSEIRRIEAMISSWDKDSQTSEINRNAGIFFLCKGQLSLRTREGFREKRKNLESRVGVTTKLFFFFFATIFHRPLPFFSFEYTPPCVCVQYRPRTSSIKAH